MEAKKRTKIRAFTFPTLLAIAFMGSNLIQFAIPVSRFSLFSILLLCCSWGFGKIAKDTNTSFKHLLYSATLISMLYIINRGWLSSFTFSEPSTELSEDIYKTKTVEAGDSIVLLNQDRAWKDNYGHRYKGTFSIREHDYYNSKQSYFRYTQQQQHIEWGTLYKYLSKADTPRLDLFIKELERIKTKRRLNKFEFAEMVVTLIQDIPYALVLGDRCKSAEEYEEGIRVILESCPECCIGNVPYGIQNPVAFMGNLKGDCDTRTVLIYTLLNYFGYDVVILNSQYYLHSILGLNMPGSGYYKKHSGKRYYTWETTNKNYTLGKLPRHVTNMNHWNVVLTNI